MSRIVHLPTNKSYGKRDKLCGNVFFCHEVIYAKIPYFCRNQDIDAVSNNETIIKMIWLLRKGILRQLT